MDIQKLYKEGRRIEGDFPTEPLPHLFLISDEFAELKQNEPEFMTGAVTAARIGRSLGFHLIQLLRSLQVLLMIKFD